jgi:hypothetical protein
MTSTKLSDFLQQPGESSTEFRDRLEVRRVEAETVRRRELAEQASDEHTPEVRIKMWERLHQVSLPRSPSHRVLGIIAAGTGLTLEDVRAEQIARTSRSS